MSMRINTGTTKYWRKDLRTRQTELNPNAQTLRTPRMGEIRQAFHASWQFRVPVERHLLSVNSLCFNKSSETHYVRFATIITAQIRTRTNTSTVGQRSHRIHNIPQTVILLDRHALSSRGLRTHFPILRKIPPFSADSG